MIIRLRVFPNPMRCEGAKHLEFAIVRYCNTRDETSLSRMSRKLKTINNFDYFGD